MQQELFIVFQIIVLNILAYLLGSLNSAVFISKKLYGVDIRTLGSKNAGSTNMYRCLGFKAGLAVQLADILKGVIAASLFVFADVFFGSFPGIEKIESLRNLGVLTGLSAVVGHIWPALADFRGGKGINTLLGTMVIVFPAGALVSLAAFIIVLMLSRYVSLGSMLGALVFPVFAFISARIAHEKPNPWLIWFGFAIFALVVLTHHQNIGRLFRKEESKVNFFRKKS